MFICNSGILRQRQQCFRDGLKIPSPMFLQIKVYSPKRHLLCARSASRASLIFYSDTYVIKAKRFRFLCTTIAELMPTIPLPLSNLTLAEDLVHIFWVNMLITHHHAKYKTRSRLRICSLRKRLPRKSYHLLNA